MSLTQKPGSDYGIDYGIVTIILFWITVALALVILFALKSQGGQLFAQAQKIHVGLGWLVSQATP